MNNKKNNTEIIELTLPLNSAYVSAARLTASSIANRLGFDIDEIEDVKVAVSEACTYIVKQFNNNSNNSFKILFTIYKDSLKVNLLLETKEKADFSSDMSIIMIKALMDELDIDYKNDSVLNIEMFKSHKLYSFEK